MESLELFLLQTLELHHPLNPKNIACLEPAKHRLFRQGRMFSTQQEQDDTWMIRQGSAWSFKHLARFPQNDRICPSTLEGTISPIRSSTSLLFEVTYRRVNEDGSQKAGEEGAAKTLSLTKKIIITSSRCSGPETQIESVSPPSHISSSPKSKVPALSITTLAECIILRPPFSATQGPMIRGLVFLDLPTTRTVDEVAVSLTARYQLTLPDQAERQPVKLLQKVCKVPIKKCLEKGEHQCSFSFVIPSNAPPSELCLQGKIWWELSARAKCTGSSDITGVGKLEVVADPVPPIETGDALVDVQIEDFTIDLGPFKLDYHSPILRLDAESTLDFILKEPPNDIRIDKVELLALQAFSLRDHRSKKVTRFDPVRQSLFKDQGGWFAAKGGEWHFKETVKVPDVEYIRPTTPEVTDTPIRCTSSLLFELTYRIIRHDGSVDDARIVSLKKKIVVSPRSCSIEDRSLPSYNELFSVTPTSASVDPCDDDPLC
ncbi:hypothetical protein BT69DRAFT_72981 [Atractiella rhizophila]|nr:hypothetical protein BT69DRAFT_72981 [Atractiella rhizophila]